MVIFQSAQFVEAPLEEVWSFFSDESNLERLTPAWLSFRVLDKSTPEMCVGTRINYALKIRGIAVKWQSEINTWEPPHRFVDEQVKGPYARWHHTHAFEARDQGTLISDQVDYALPFGWIGSLGNWFVKRDVQKIFDHRRQIIQELFSR